MTDQPCPGDLAERHRAAGRLSEAMGVLRQELRTADADLGAAHPTTSRLRARLTRLLVDLGRDGEAAEVEAGTLGFVRRGEGSVDDGR